MAAGALGASGCGLLFAAALVLPGPVEASDIGMASFYGRAHIGHRTASGKRYDANAMTAAHRSLPFGTRLMVTNLSNGKSVVVEIADRGPFGHARIVDLSYAAAAQLGFVRQGVTKVKLDPL